MNLPRFVYCNTLSSYQGIPLFNADDIILSYQPVTCRALSSAMMNLTLAVAEAIEADRATRAAAAREKRES